MAVPVEINNLMLGSVSGYQISRSVRFRSSATAYFNRTPASATNRTTWTWSGWVKRGSLTSDQVLFQGYSDANNFTVVLWDSGDRIQLQNRVAATSTFNWLTTSVYRDPSAYYHVVAVFDTTQATSTNRIKIYVNGVEITAYTTQTTGSQNATGFINNTNGHNIGRSGAATQYFDGYLTETNFVDGQALTPSSFGEYDSITGVWKPKKFTGTYGTNGFYLNFSDNSAATAAAIGKDYSGNGNNWTPNNISVTAGVTYDSMIDVPTPYADGSTGRGNYATLNPIGVPYNTGTAAGGNLNWTGAATADKGRAATISMSSGKWYWECTVTATAAGSNSYVGIVKTAGTADSNANRVYYRGDGAVLKYGTSTTGLTTYTTNDVIGIAYDYSAQTLAFYKNNTLVTTATSINLEDNLPWVGGYTTTESWAFNAGQRPFSYTPPSGFKALNTQNLPTPTIANGASYMAATTYTGTGAALTIANSANNTIGTTFQPNFLWIKSRSGAASHLLWDSVRGTTVALNSDRTAAEQTETAGTGLTSFNSNGFTLGTDFSGTGQSNANAVTYVAWQWQAGTASGVSNTNGSITSTVSANTTAGFSVVTYTGTGANATVGHGLGVAPKMLIVKSNSTVTSWSVYHSSIGAANELLLNSTAASAASATSWNSTAPTSSVFSVGTASSTNTSPRTYVAYCFADVAGYSAFGSYTGNGSADGPFVVLGFRPRWLMIKNSSSAGDDWILFDSSRDTYNVTNLNLRANTSGAESTQAANYLDFLSNGFKIRGTSAGTINASQTYIYMAFAENPFKYSLAR